MSKGDKLSCVGFILIALCVIFAAAYVATRIAAFKFVGLGVVSFLLIGLIWVLGKSLYLDGFEWLDEYDAD